MNITEQTVVTCNEGEVAEIQIFKDSQCDEFSNSVYYEFDKCGDNRFHFDQEKINSVKILPNNGFFQLQTNLDFKCEEEIGSTSYLKDTCYPFYNSNVKFKCSKPPPPLCSKEELILVKLFSENTCDEEKTVRDLYFLQKVSQPSFFVEGTVDKYALINSSLGLFQLSICQDSSCQFVNSVETFEMNKCKAVSNIGVFVYAKMSCSKKPPPICPQNIVSIQNYQDEECTRIYDITRPLYFNLSVSQIYHSNIPKFEKMNISITSEVNNLFGVNFENNNNVQLPLLFSPKDFCVNLYDTGEFMKIRCETEVPSLCKKKDSLIINVYENNECKEVNLLRIIKTVPSKCVKENLYDTTYSIANVKYNGFTVATSSKKTCEDHKSESFLGHLVCEKHNGISEKTLKVECSDKDIQYECENNNTVFFSVFHGNKDCLTTARVSSSSVKLERCQQFWVNGSKYFVWVNNDFHSLKFSFYRNENCSESGLLANFYARKERCENVKFTLDKMKFDIYFTCGKEKKILKIIIIVASSVMFVLFLLLLFFFMLATVICIKCCKRMKRKTLFVQETIVASAPEIDEKTPFIQQKEDRQDYYVPEIDEKNSFAITERDNISVTFPDINENWEGK